MRKINAYIFCLTLFTLSVTNGQIYNDYSNINNHDIIDALAFTGIGIFKFQIDSLKEAHNFYLILDEYVGKNNLVKTDTLLGYSPFEINTNNIGTIRFLTKIINNSYDTTYLFISTSNVAVFKEIVMNKKYVRKHYWLKFSKSEVAINKKIPLLFYASEWDAIVMGIMDPKNWTRN